MNIAIVGGGELAQAIIKSTQHQHITTVFGRQHTDLTKKKECDQLVNRLINFDVVLYTAGLFNADIWDMWTVNTLAPCYIVTQLINNNYSGHTIVVSSHAANWTSWPGVDISRLNYNGSKHAISEFVKGIQHSGVVGRYSLLEPSRFQSKMGGNSGHPIEVVVEAVKYLLENPAKSITI